MRRITSPSKNQRKSCSRPAQRLSLQSSTSFLPRRGWQPAPHPNGRPSKGVPRSARLTKSATATTTAISATVLHIFPSESRLRSRFAPSPARFCSACAISPPQKTEGNPHSLSHRYALSISASVLRFSTRPPRQCACSLRKHDKSMAEFPNDGNFFSSGRAYRNSQRSDREENAAAQTVVTGKYFLPRRLQSDKINISSFDNSVAAMRRRNGIHYPRPAGIRS